jgi:uncharacterized protein with NRDE domain
MCLILFSLNNHPNYKLVIAANRDEFFERRTSAAGFWNDYPDLLGGRDLEAGGTWMGMTRQGKIAMITNYRDPANIRSTAPSRGKLVSDYLIHKKNASGYLTSLQRTSADYNGFNLLAGTADELFYFSNYHEGVHRVAPGLHGLSNHLLETPWPKVIRGKKRLEHVLLQNKISSDELFDLLYDNHLAPDNQLPDTGIGKERERALSSMFIKTPNYGTRCSTVVLINHQNEVLYAERVYDLTTYQFTTKKFEFKLQ